MKNCNGNVCSLKDRSCQNSCAFSRRKIHDSGKNTKSLDKSELEAIHSNVDTMKKGLKSKPKNKKRSFKLKPSHNKCGTYDRYDSHDSYDDCYDSYDDCHDKKEKCVVKIIIKEKGSPTIICFV